MSIETLKKINYENLEQFVEDINRNFATIENSPLYKGIPGEEGDDGDTGQPGIRGSKFLFVIYSKFYEQFPNELSSPSQVNLNFLNSKLENFTDKQKLLDALDVTEFVDKDVIVLVNSQMMSYSSASYAFVNTFQAFNPETNLLSNINQLIADQVQYYIENNSDINSLINLFTPYNTLAKNFADNNSSFITNELLSNSVFSPYIPGYNNQVGVNVNNHKYFGYTDSLFPITNTGTFVFGNMKKYYNLLMSTISTESNASLSSDYAPGNGNIPALVVLQDTYKNGIYFGHKDRPNLKRFGSIYKNDNHDVVIKSDSSLVPSEYSELKINRAYLQFDKLVRFLDTLEVSRNLNVFGDVNTAHYKTGQFTQGAQQSNNFNINRAEFGRRTTGSVALNVSEFEEYVHYLGNVLVTDENGRVSKNYRLENMALNNAQLVNLNQMTGIPNNPLNVLTSNYYFFLATKVNNVSAYLANNYWRKDQFNTGEIPNFKVSNQITAPVATIGGINTSSTGQTTIITSAITWLTSQNITMSSFPGKVLVTNNDGTIVNTYSIETATPTFSYNPTWGLDLIMPLGGANPQNRVLTSNYYNTLANMHNLLVTQVGTNYWTKPQFESGVIPKLRLWQMLDVAGQAQFKNADGSTHLRYLDNNNGTADLMLGSNATTVRFDGSDIGFTNFVDKVIVTNSQGKVMNQYFIANLSTSLVFVSQTNPSSGAVYNTPSVSIPSTSNTTDLSAIPTWRNIKLLAQHINGLIGWMGTNYWRKDQYNTAEIPAMKIGGTLAAFGDVAFGPEGNPNISTVGTTTNLGKTSGTTKIRGAVVQFEGRNSKVIVTDANGNVADYTLAEQVPTSSNPGLPTPVNPDYFNNASWIKQQFWTKSTHLQSPQNFLNIDNSPTKVLTARYLSWIVNNFRAIRDLIYDRPTYADMNLSAVPIGGVIIWMDYFGAVPSNFVECNGQPIPGITPAVNTPDFTNKFPKGGLPGFIGGNDNHQVGLVMNNIPAHTHTMPEHQHFMFTNQGTSGNNLENAPNNYVRLRAWDTSSNYYDYHMGASNPNYPANAGKTGWGGGGQTYSTGSANPTKVNIEPRSMSVRFIMRYQ